MSRPDPRALARLPLTLARRAARRVQDDVAGDLARLHAALRRRHDRRHPVSAPANVRHRDSLRLIDHIALAISDVVGTMGCAVLFTALACVSLPAALATGNLVVIIGWIAQTFLQLVLLSVILNAGNLQSRQSETRAEAEYEAVLAMKAALDRLEAAATVAPPPDPPPVARARRGAAAPTPAAPA